MKQQRLIELIRSASLKQALEFVQVSAFYTPLTRLLHASHSMCQAGLHLVVCVSQGAQVSDASLEATLNHQA
jgi:hypothetical protein